MVTFNKKLAITKENHTKYNPFTYNDIALNEKATYNEAKSLHIFFFFFFVIGRIECTNKSSASANRLLGRYQDLPLSPSESIQDLANDFNNFFIRKIQKIKPNLKSQAPTIDCSEENYGILDVPQLPPSKLMYNFILVNYKDVIKL